MPAGTRTLDESSSGAQEEALDKLHDYACGAGARLSPSALGVMNILSFFHFPGAHDTSAALVRDGILVAATEEERLTRVKHDGSVPLRSIEFCLDQSGLAMSDVDLIAFPDLPFRSGAGSRLSDIDARTLGRLYRHGEAKLHTFLHYAGVQLSQRLGRNRRSWQLSSQAEAVFRQVSAQFGPLPRIVYYQHHRAHAASAFLTSGDPDAAICTADGRGDVYSAVTWRGRGSAVRRLSAEPWFNSLGFFYRDCTDYLGLGPFAEGEAMGLSAYGAAAELEVPVGRLLNTQATSRWYRYEERPSQQALGFPPRTDADATSSPYPQFAAAAQAALERALFRMADSALKQSRSGSLCMGGGVALNCAANGRLLARPEIESLWAFAASGDAGLSVGAALLAAADAGELPRQRLDHAYFGPETSEAEIIAAVETEPTLELRRPRDVVEEAAGRLAADQIIGWSQGRMELGPRALGNRSILANPASTETRDRVNRLKGRESWRPLAPSILAERAGEYFELPGESPFMLLAAPVRPRTRAEAPAIVHADGSARPQTVRQDQNPKFRRLLEAFERRTAVPMLLNTSFNIAGEPIVCDAMDGIRSFQAMGLDAFVCGDFVITAKNQPGPRSTSNRKGPPTAPASSR